MIISYNTDKETGEQKLSGDILIMEDPKDVKEDEEAKVRFTIPLIDVRDGGIIEEEYEAKYNTIDKWGAKKIYKRLVSTGVKLQAEALIKESNKTQGSKFIPKKQQFHF